VPKVFVNHGQEKAREIVEKDFTATADLEIPQEIMESRTMRDGSGHVATWDKNPTVQKRLFRVYQAYLSHTPVWRIAEMEKISVPQVYVDINRARETTSKFFKESMGSMVMELIESRRSVLWRVNATIDALLGPLAPNSGPVMEEDETRTQILEQNSFSSDEDDEDDEYENSAANGVTNIGGHEIPSILVRGKVLSDLFNIQDKNLKAIEEIVLGKSSGGGRFNHAPSEGEDLPKEFEKSITINLASLARPQLTAEEIGDQKDERIVNYLDS
jgi:hypothetical protein